MALIAGALLIIYFGTGIIITRRANRNIYKETEKEAYKMDAGGHSDEERVEYIRERDESIWDFGSDDEYPSLHWE